MALKEQRKFYLFSCSFDVASVLGGIDEQLRCVLPVDSFLDVLGLIEDEIAHVSECSEPRGILQFNRPRKLRGPASPIGHQMWLYILDALNA
jgi:hypothetical protein